jgi:mitogen-activated protein kinase 1/3
LIFDLIGTPTKDELKNIENDKWREFARKAKKRKSQDFDKFFPKSNPLAIDLLKKCLVFDPNKRFNVE